VEVHRLRGCELYWSVREQEHDLRAPQRIWLQQRDPDTDAAVGLQAVGAAISQSPIEDGSALWPRQRCPIVAPGASGFPPAAANVHGASTRRRNLLAGDGVCRPLPIIPLPRLTQTVILFLTFPAPRGRPASLSLGPDTFPRYNAPARSRSRFRSSFRTRAVR